VDDTKFIRFISPGSVAAQHPMLCVGDRILTVSLTIKINNNNKFPSLSLIKIDHVMQWCTISAASSSIIFC